MKLLKGIAFIIGLLILIGFFFGPEEQVGTETATHTEPKQPERAAAKCDHGSPISGSFYVKGSDINFRMGPGINHARVVNQKATDILGSTQHPAPHPLAIHGSRGSLRNNRMAESANR